MAKSKEIKYSKEQIINSKKYANHKDLLNAVLIEDNYTTKEINEIISKFMKGKVM